MKGRGDSTMNATKSILLMLGCAVLALVFILADMQINGAKEVLAQSGTTSNPATAIFKEGGDYVLTYTDDRQEACVVKSISGDWLLCGEEDGNKMWVNANTPKTATEIQRQR